MTFSIDELDHGEVLVRDIDTAIAWYDEVLGSSPSTLSNAVIPREAEETR